MDKILQKIQNKMSGSEDILGAFKDLPNSELNTFLLELFRQKSVDISPTELLNQFKNNRFVTPANTDIVRIKQTELEWLTYARENHFQPVNLSPLAPFGSCSAIAFVDQNNVVSSLRGTEIVSDVTNVLALKIADEFQKANDKKLVLKYTTTHRHVRGQYFSNPNYSAHFSVFCLASGGFDTGNYGFEINQMNEHLSMLYHLLTTRFDEKNLLIRFYTRTRSEHFKSQFKNSTNQFWKNKPVEFTEEFENKYYSTIQFKIFLKRDNQEIDLGDGGVVDWTQKLLGNRKHRLFISGIGLELVEKLLLLNSF